MPTNKPGYMYKYYNEHRQSFLDRVKEKIPCDLCGNVISKGHINRHQKSKICSRLKAMTP